MSNRDKIMWNADPLTDELSRQPSFDGDSDDDIVGTDWGKVGKTALGVNHMVGKTLLKAIGMGGVADSMETLQAKGGALPDWATKTMKVVSPDYVVIARGNKDPLVVNNAANVTIFGGKRFDGAGWQSGAPLGAAFSTGVDSPTRVEIAYKSGSNIMKTAKASGMTDVSMVLFLGGAVASCNLDALDAPAVAQPAAGGMGGGMKISGDDDAVGYSAYDIAANIFTGGMYAAGKEGFKKDRSTAITFVEPTRDTEADARIAAGKQSAASSKQRLADIQKQRAALRAARGRGSVTPTPVDTGDFARRLEVARQQIAASTGEDQASDAQQGDAQPETVSGLEFKWKYLFAPHLALEDKEREDAMDRSIHFTEPTRDAEVDSRIDENEQRTADAVQRLADAKAKLAALRAERMRRLSTRNKTQAVLGELSRLGIINSKGSNAMAHDDNELETEHDEELEAIMGDLGYVNIIGSADADDEIVGSAHYRTEIIGGRKRKIVKKAQPSDSGPVCADASKEGGMCDLLGVDGNGSSYIMGCDILGADAKPTPRAGFVKLNTSGGNTVLSLRTNKAKKGDHKSTYRNAVDVGTRAVSIGTKLKNAVKAGGTKVKGYDDDMILDDVLDETAEDFVGALVRRTSKPKRRNLTHAQIKKIAEQTTKAGKDLLAYAKKYGDQVKAHEAKITTATAATSKKMAKAKVSAKASAAPQVTAAARKPAGARAAGTRVSGDAFVLGYGDSDMLGETNIFGAEILGDLGPRDLYDDLDVMGEIDILGLEQTVELLGTHFEILGDELAVDAAAPAADAAASGIDPLADAVAAIGSPPTAAPPLQPGVDYAPDPYPNQPQMDPNEYRGAELPLLAIKFDGSVDLGRSEEALVGSANRFLANGPATKTNGMDSGFQFSSDWWQTFNAGGSAGRRYSSPNSGEMDDLSASSLQNGWGPLIGRPDTEMAGARYHVPTKTWFWYYDTAPAPLLAKLKAPGELLRFNQAIAEYKTALTAFKTEQAAQAAADQLEAEQAAALAKQTALEDAATARRQEQEAKESEHQAALQTKADEQAQTTQSAIQAAQAAAYAAKTSTETEAYKGQAQADAEAYKGQAQADAESQSAYAQTRAELDEKKLQAEEDRTLRMAEKEAEFMAAHPDAGEPTDDGGAQGGGEDQGGGQYDGADQTTRELHEEAGTPEQYQDEADAQAMDQE